MDFNDDPNRWRGSRQHSVVPRPIQHNNFAQSTRRMSVAREETPVMLIIMQNQNQNQDPGLDPDQYLDEGWPEDYFDLPYRAPFTVAPLKRQISSVLSGPNAKRRQDQQPHTHMRVQAPLAQGSESRYSAHMQSAPPHAPIKAERFDNPQWNQGRISNHPRVLLPSDTDNNSSIQVSSTYLGPDFRSITQHVPIPNPERQLIKRNDSDRRHHSQSQAPLQRQYTDLTGPEPYGRRILGEETNEEKQHQDFGTSSIQRLSTHHEHVTPNNSVRHPSPAPSQVLSLSINGRRLPRVIQRRDLNRSRLVKTAESSPQQPMRANNQGKRAELASSPRQREIIELDDDDLTMVDCFRTHIKEVETSVSASGPPQNASFVATDSCFKAIDGFAKRVLKRSITKDRELSNSRNDAQKSEVCNRPAALAMPKDSPVTESSKTQSAPIDLGIKGFGRMVRKNVAQREECASTPTNLQSIEMPGSSVFTGTSDDQARHVVESRELKQQDEVEQQDGQPDSLDNERAPPTQSPTGELHEDERPAELEIETNSLSGDACDEAEVQEKPIVMQSLQSLEMRIREESKSAFKQAEAAIRRRFESEKKEKIKLARKGVTEQEHKKLAALKFAADNRDLTMIRQIQQATQGQDEPIVEKSDVEGHKSQAVLERSNWSEFGADEANSGPSQPGEVAPKVSSERLTTDTEQDSASSARRRTTLKSSATKSNQKATEVSLPEHLESLFVEEHDEVHTDPARIDFFQKAEELHQQNSNRDTGSNTRQQDLNLSDVAQSPKKVNTPMPSVSSKAKLQPTSESSLLDRIFKPLRPPRKQSNDKKKKKTADRLDQGPHQDSNGILQAVAQRAAQEAVQRYKQMNGVQKRSGHDLDEIYLNFNDQSLTSAKDISAEFADQTNFNASFCGKQPESSTRDRLPSRNSATNPLVAVHPNLFREYSSVVKLKSQVEATERQSEEQKKKEELRLRKNRQSREKKFLERKENQILKDAMMNKRQITADEVQVELKKALAVYQDEIAKKEGKSEVSSSGDNSPAYTPQTPRNEDNGGPPPTPEKNGEMSPRAKARRLEEEKMQEHLNNLKASNSMSNNFAAAARKKVVQDLESESEISEEDPDPEPVPASNPEKLIRSIPQMDGGNSPIADKPDRRWNKHDVSRKRRKTHLLSTTSQNEISPRSNKSKDRITAFKSPTDDLDTIQFLSSGPSDEELTMVYSVNRQRSEGELHGENILLNLFTERAEANAFAREELDRTRWQSQDKNGAENYVSCVMNYSDGLFSGIVTLSEEKNITELVCVRSQLQYTGNLHDYKPRKMEAQVQEKSFFVYQSITERRFEKVVVEIEDDQDIMPGYEDDEAHHTASRGVRSGEMSMDGAGDTEGNVITGCDAADGGSAEAVPGTSLAGGTKAGAAVEDKTSIDSLFEEEVEEAFQNLDQNSSPTEQAPATQDTTFDTTPQAGAQFPKRRATKSVPRPSSSSKASTQGLKDLLTIHMTTTPVAQYTQRDLANASAAKHFLSLIKPKRAKIDALERYHNVCERSVRDLLAQLDMPENRDQFFDAEEVDEKSGKEVRVWVQEWMVKGPKN